jgi:hypothetical protein
MEDVRDPEARERFESVAPDAYLRRREFLQRTAMAATTRAAPPGSCPRCRSSTRRS